MLPEQEEHFVHKFSSEREQLLQILESVVRTENVHRVGVLEYDMQVRVPGLKEVQKELWKFHGREEIDPARVICDGDTIVLLQRKSSTCDVAAVAVLSKKQFEKLPVDEIRSSIELISDSKAEELTGLLDRRVSAESQRLSQEAKKRLVQLEAFLEAKTALGDTDWEFQGEEYPDCVMERYKREYWASTVEVCKSYTGIAFNSPIHLYHASVRMNRLGGFPDVVGIKPVPLDRLAYVEGEHVEKLFSRLSELHPPNRDQGVCERRYRRDLSLR